MSIAIKFAVNKKSYYVIEDKNNCWKSPARITYLPYSDSIMKFKDEKEVKKWINNLNSPYFNIIHDKKKKKYVLSYDFNKAKTFYLIRAVDGEIDINSIKDNVYPNMQLINYENLHKKYKAKEKIKEKLLNEKMEELSDGSSPKDLYELANLYMGAYREDYWSGKQYSFSHYLNHQDMNEKKYLEYLNKAAIAGCGDANYVLLIGHRLGFIPLGRRNEAYERKNLHIKKDLKKKYYHLLLTRMADSGEHWRLELIDEKGFIKDEIEMCEKLLSDEEKNEIKKEIRNAYC